MSGVLGSSFLTTDRHKPVKLSEYFGGEVEVFNFSNNTIELCSVKAVDTGVDECVKLKTEFGSSVTVSGKSLVFDIKKGWMYSGNTVVGCKILVAPCVLSVTKDDATYGYTELLLDYAVKDKCVLSEVYGLPQNELIEYLKSIFLYYGKVDKRNGCIGFSLFSKHLAFDLRLLLLRFGIQSRVSSDGNLKIDNQMDISGFLNTVLGIFTPVLDVRGPRVWAIVTDVEYIGQRKTQTVVMDSDVSECVFNTVVVKCR